MSDRSVDIDKAFSGLDAGLCLRARAMGETPLKAYFHEVTPNVRRLLINDKVFQVVLTLAEDEKPSEG
jgi:hypothetical protein